MEEVTLKEAVNVGSKYHNPTEEDLLKISLINIPQTPDVSIDPSCHSINVPVLEMSQVAAKYGFGQRN